MNLRNLKFDEIESNAAGIRGISFLIKKSDITAYPSFADAPANATADVTLEGDFTLAPGAHFVELYTRKGTGSVSFEPTGPKDGKFFIEKAELDYPDLDDAARSLAKSTVNGDHILVVGIRVANSDKFKFITIGNEMFPCELSPTGNTGSLDSPDGKGLKIEVSSYSNTPLSVYTGTIKLENGTFDCETGIFTPTPEA